MSNYVVWRWGRVPGGCSVVELMNVPRVFALKKGEPRGTAFPSDAAFRMDPDAKRDTLLVDNIPNVEVMLLCSERLKQFIESRQPPAIEYLPVTVQDHKKRPVPQAHFVVLPLDPPDCIDLASSVVKRSMVDPTALMSVKKLVLDESKIPSDRLIVKPKGYPLATFFRRDLAAEIDAQGFTGIAWKEVADFAS